MAIHRDDPAKLIVSPKCDGQCCSECDPKWIVQQDPTSEKWFVVAMHCEEESLDHDGEPVGFHGAWVEMATEEEFETEQKAAQYLKDITV